MYDGETDDLRAVVAVALCTSAGDGQSIVALGGDAGHDLIVAVLDGHGVVGTLSQHSAVGCDYCRRDANSRASVEVAWLVNGCFLCKYMGIGL